MKNDILPIGSVINIKDNKDRFIIIGHLKNNDSYVYVCVKYPYGYVEAIDFNYITNDEIESLVFLGDINY